MSWLASFFIGFLTAIVGALGAGTLAAGCVEWYRIPSREGASGYFMVIIGLFGLLGGFIIGLVAARIVAAGGSPGFLRGLGVAVGSCVGLLAISTLIAWMSADRPTTLGGRDVELHAEIRCPVGFELAAKSDADKWYAHLDTRSRRHTSRTDLPLEKATKVDGHWIIPFTLALDTSVREKLLYVIVNGEHQLFIPIFPAKPGKKYMDWSNWLEGGWETGKPKPTPDQSFFLRFRLEICLPTSPTPAPAPVPTEEEIRAKKEAEDVTVFGALAPDAPISEWLRFTHYAQPEQRRLKAGVAIARRPNLVAELSPQILSSDHETSDRALRAVAVIEPLPGGLAEAVSAVGEAIIADLKRFNASKPEDDPGYQVAADISVRFSGWFVARYALQEKAGVDGRAQMEAILEVARIREDSYVLKNDVTRLARRYLELWSPKVEAGRP